MNKTTLISVVVWLAVGAGLAGLYAQKNEVAAAQTSRSLIASMVTPSNSLESPRTYNQTLVETVDTTALVTALNQQNLPVSSVTFDVLPDSFHIQVTATLTETVSQETANTVGRAITKQLQQNSTALVGKLFTQNNPPTTAVVDLTRVLPLEATIQQQPASAAIYGGVAGALFGWFFGLTLNDRRRTK